MKNYISLLAILAISISGNTQNAPANKFIWSIGVQPSLPLGHFTKYSDFGLGGSVQGEYKPGRVGITLNAGYIDYFGKSVSEIKYADFRYIPLLAGIKYYMSSKAYLHGQVGPGFGTNGLGTSFWYGAGVGLSFSKAIDAELGYMGWKQDLITTTTNNGGTSGYGSGVGGGGYGGGTGGGGYGGHYPTIGLRLAYNF